MNTKTKEILQDSRQASAYRCLEDVIGCKWSVSVLLAVKENVVRPGAMENHIPGISAKVLSERLRKLMLYGLLIQHRYAESPPRTEYELTSFGSNVVALISKIRALDEKK